MINNVVDLTHQTKNLLIFVQGPEITIRPVSARRLIRGDAVHRHAGSVMIPSVWVASGGYSSPRIRRPW